MSSKFLVHMKADSIGVVIENITKGEKVEGVYMDTFGKLQVKAVENITFGHKIAIKQMEKGRKVIEYGESIGEVVHPIKKGAHVHTHNIKSLRW